MFPADVTLSRGMITVFHWNVFCEIIFFLSRFSAPRRYQSVWLRYLLHQHCRCRGVLKREKKNYCNAVVAVRVKRDLGSTVLSNHARFSREHLLLHVTFRVSHRRRKNISFYGDLTEHFSLCRRKRKFTFYVRATNFRIADDADLTNSKSIICYDVSFRRSLRFRKCRFHFSNCFLILVNFHFCHQESRRRFQLHLSIFFFQSVCYCMTSSSVFGNSRENFFLLCDVS